MWTDDVGHGAGTARRSGPADITQPIRTLAERGTGTGAGAGTGTLPPPPEEAVLARLLVDRDGTILAFDRGAEELTGWSAVEISGHARDVRNGGPFARALIETADRTAGGERGVRTQLRLERADRGRIDVEVRVLPADTKGRHLRVDVLRVVRELEPVSLIEAGLGEVDPLTGLVGPVLFREALEGAVSSSAGPDAPVSLLLVDLDHRESLDDLSSEQGRGRLLASIAAQLLEVARPEDLVARLGAGTFGVLATGLDAGAARTLAGRVRQRIEQGGVEGSDGRPVRVTASIGVATYPWVGHDAGDLLRRAGEALAEARRLGGNRVWSYVRRPRVPVTLPVFFDAPGAPSLGTITDLSHSGMFVASDAPLRPGMRLALAFRLPGDDDSIRVLGCVARQDAEQTGEPGGGAGIGIEFERMSDSDRRRLEGFLYDERRAR